MEMGNALSCPAKYYQMLGDASSFHELYPIAGMRSHLPDCGLDNPLAQSSARYCILTLTRIYKNFIPFQCLMLVLFISFYYVKECTSLLTNFQSLCDYYVF